MKTIILSAILLCSVLSVNAADALHRIRLSDCDAFTVVTPPAYLYIYPLSERATHLKSKGILAADYSLGARIRTKDPRTALARIARQVAEQTGRSLGYVSSGGLEAMAPSAMLMAFDTDSVWCFVLSPKEEEDVYLVACGCVLFSRKPANQ